MEKVLKGSSETIDSRCPPHEGISEYWRRNTSPWEAVELANLLKALRKVAGHLGPNIGNIEYAGMSRGDSSAIVLDPAEVMGRYPVPPAQVDAFVGLVIHEGLHQVEWSEHVWKLLENDFTHMAPHAVVRFQKIIQTGEDIYVDYAVQESVLSLYLQKARRKAIQEAWGRLSTGEPSVDALVNLWWAKMSGEGASLVMSAIYTEPLAALVFLTHELLITRSTESIISRCEQRALCYREAWHTLEKMIAPLKIVDKRLLWYQGREGPGEEREPFCKGRASSAVLSSELVQEIKIHLAATSADITPLIYSALGSEREDVIPTSRWDYQISAHPVIDRGLVGRLKTIFLGYSERETAWSRGLPSGKLDARRLYRAAISDRCFKRLDARPSMDWNVTLIIDASGSMRGPKWRIVENTVAAIHKALTGYRNHFQAYAYFESDGICMISSLTKGRQLLSVPPTGQTASGQALIAAALFMPKDRKRRLLIHITDGEANLGCDVQLGIDYCKAKHITLVTLGCGCKDQNAMRAQYGNTIQFIDTFRQLPLAVERLMKWSFIYDERRPSLGFHQPQGGKAQKQDQEEDNR